MERKLDVSIELENGIFTVTISDWESGETMDFQTDDLSLDEIGRKAGSEIQSWAELMLDSEL